MMEFVEAVNAMEEQTIDVCLFALIFVGLILTTMVFCLVEAFRK